MPNLFRCLAAAAIGLPAALACGQTISEVPTLPGGSFTRVYGVSANGTVAAGYADDNLGRDMAIRWTLAGGTGNMGFLPGGSVNSYAQAINADGSVVVGYGDSGGNTKPFRWTLSGGYSLIPIDSAFGRANAVSADGLVVVGTKGLGAGANGFTWDLLNCPNCLGPFVICVGGGTGNAGLAVSADGSTIGGACGSAAVVRTYVPNSVLGTITGIPGQQWQMSEAISANGAFIAGRYSPNTGGEFGFRYGLTVPGFVEALPLTPNGAVALRPRAISGNGDIIVGQVFDNVAGLTGFAWTPATGTQLITTHLQARGLNTAGWSITDVTGISSDGTAMCGYGLHNGQPRGFVIRNLACTNIAAALNQVAGCVGGSAQIQSFFNVPPGVTPAFRWFKNGVKINNGLQPSGSTISGAATGTLVFSNLQAGDAGSYTLGVSAYGACETLSSAFNFGGPSTLTIVNQPGNSTVCLGANPSFFAAATFPSGGVTTKWQKLVTPPNIWANINDGPSGFGGTYFGTNTTTFSIFNAQGADTGTYRCVFNVSGCSLATQSVSNPAQLVVIDSLPAILGPFDTSVCPGDNDAFLSVTVNPCNGCTFQWQKYAGPCVNCYNDIFNGPTGNGGNYGGTNTPTLTVAGVYPGDFAQYRCVINMPCAGRINTEPASINATPEASIVSGPTVGSACDGGLGSITVVATPPGTTYQWQRYVGPCTLCWQDIADGPTGNGGTFSGAQTPTLDIAGFNIFETFTTYRCVVTGPCGLTPAASPAAQFPLQTQPIFQTQPTDDSVCIGGTTQLAVALAPGDYGTVTYQWWRYIAAFPIYQQVSNGALPSGAAATGAQSATLTISNFQQQDAGQYYCMVTGSCGPVPSAVAALSVCLADYNCSGSVTVQDLFDFLAGYFTQNPQADVNNSGTITVQDIFDFMALYFAGC